jgi:hypothetical protein
MYKKRKLPGEYEVTVDFLNELFIKQNGQCAISGHLMTHIAGKGQVPTNISIDRIDSKKGYQKDNIQLLCRCVNYFKMNMSNQEAKEFWGKCR